MPDTPIGREAVVEELVGLAMRGSEVLVWGPIGIGKTTVLHEVARRLRAAGHACGLASRTAGLGDITGALAEADSGACTTSPKALRSSLRRTADNRPTVLLLDHVVKASPALKGFLRSLRATRAGLICAVDADHPRDHSWARAQHLAYREIKLPALSRRHMQRLLAAKVAAADLPSAPEDEALLLDIAHGRPGWIDMIVERLADQVYWRGHRVRVQVLRLDIGVAIAERYMSATIERLSARER